MYRRGLFFWLSFVILIGVSNGEVRAATYSGKVYNSPSLDRGMGSVQVILQTYVPPVTWYTYTTTTQSYNSSLYTWPANDPNEGTWSITFNSTGASQINISAFNSSPYSNSCGMSDWGGSYSTFPNPIPGSCTVNFLYVFPTTLPTPTLIPTPTVGPGIPSPTPPTTPTASPTPTPTPVSWWQVGGAGILSAGNISSALPVGKNLVIGNVGVVASKNSIITAGGGLSTSNWKLQGTNSIADTFLSKFNFDTVRSRVRTYTKAKDTTNKVSGTLANCFWGQAGILTESGVQGSCIAVPTATPTPISTPAPTPIPTPTPTLVPFASGGTITTNGGYTYHTFTSNGTFTPSRSGNIEVLIVGGGGGGGGSAAINYNGGGGGAGGLINNSSVAVTAQAYPIVIGAGGTGGGSEAAGTSGQNSSAFSLTAIGGGCGAYATTGCNGGSGGGAGGHGNSSGSASSGTVGQGNSGGGTNYQSGRGAGGGGAGGNGAWGTTSGPGSGGLGLAVWGSIYAKGGDGAYTNAGIAGGANTGNGGGGTGTYYGSGAAGGSGIVVIRYSSVLGTSTSNSKFDIGSIGIYLFNFVKNFLKI